MYKKSIIIIISIIVVILVVLFIINKQSRNNKTSNIINDKKEVDSMKVIIDNKEYELILENNDTVESLYELLPLDLNMKELNGNEKYFYLDKELPSSPIEVKKINKGDVMLYGDDCLVIFYKSFDTSYSYTKIGHIDNLPELSKDSIRVEFNNSL